MHLHAACNLLDADRCEAYASLPGLLRRPRVSLSRGTSQAAATGGEYLKARPAALGWSEWNGAHHHTDGDVVLLREKRLASHEGILVKLKEAKRTATHRGNIQHSDVIGKSLRQIVSTSKGVDYRIHEPTLAEYVRLTPRIVTPVRLEHSFAHRHVHSGLLFTMRRYIHPMPTSSSPSWICM